MTQASPAEIIENYQKVLSEITAAEPAPGRVALVAVTKTVPADSIRPLLDAGQRRFGENRVQEAMAKWPALKEDFPDIELHLIGPLQTNKVKEAVALFDVVETVDRPRLAEALAREMDRSGRRLDCLVEVNTGAEPQKAGVTPEAAEGFVVACREQWRLSVRGLMCIPPFDQDPAPHFSRLAGLAARLGLPVLSMGMSADFALAASMGATHVRVGSALFGSRPPPGVSA